MFSKIYGESKDVVDGLNNNSSRFPYKWNSTIYVNMVIALVRPKDVMVYA